MKHLALVDATDLTSWANRRDAQGVLPQLLRRLIQATNGGVSRIGMRAGDGVLLGGWDGIVATDQGTTWVPLGLSAWESGAEKQVKKKADDDYGKRCADPLGIDPATSTFVFVTPRRWAGNVCGGRKT